jgi:GNAT superfamily N-acetyltransferase
VWFLIIDIVLSEVIALSDPVVARLEDIPAMIELSSQVFKTDMGGCFPLLFSTENVENMTVVREAGKPVTMVGMLPREISVFGHRLKAGLIGAVCTHPDYRGRDYGAKALTMSEKMAIEKGISLFIISGKRGLYSRFGAVEPDGFYKLRVLPGKASRVREASEEDLSRIARFYTRRPVRYFRNLSQFRRVFATGRVMVRASRTFISEKTYVTVIKFRDSNYIVEHAGCESDVIEAARGYLQLSGEKECVLVLDSLFSSEEREKTGFEGTMKVISIDNFLDQLEGYYREVMTDREFEAFREGARGLTTAEFTRMVLLEGSIKGSPLPLPVYGFDYI